MQFTCTIVSIHIQSNAVVYNLYYTCFQKKKKINILWLNTIYTQKGSSGNEPTMTSVYKSIQ